MVIEAVCQPLAASPLKIVWRAAASSRWKGCGSNSAAKLLTRSASTRRRACAVLLPRGEILEVALGH
jgi:hypothetical protein